MVGANSHRASRFPRGSKLLIPSIGLLACGVFLYWLITVPHPKSVVVFRGPACEVLKNAGIPVAALAGGGCQGKMHVSYGSRRARLAYAVPEGGTIKVNLHQSEIMGSYRE